MLTDPTQQVAFAAMMRVVRGLAPPAVAVAEAVAFLEMPEHLVDQAVVLSILRTKTQIAVKEGIADFVRGEQREVESSRMYRLGWSLASGYLERGARGPEWSNVRVDELYDGWLAGDADVCDPLYLERGEAA